eukprot:5129322-Alexandrium_andersonii.AAC.1
MDRFQLIENVRAWQAARLWAALRRPCEPPQSKSALAHGETRPQWRGRHTDSARVAPTSPACLLPSTAVLV